MIDAHLHLCDEVLFEHARELITRALEKGVKRFLCVVTNADELERAFVLKEQFPFLDLSASTTPHDAATLEDPFFAKVAQAAKEGKIQAIGETGLEYFHPGLDRELQKVYLDQYLSLSKETHLPLVFHCRQGFEDLFERLKRFTPRLKGMVHCFTGTDKEAEMALELGLYISISGIVTFKKSIELQDVVRSLPLEKMLIETDSPYLAPQTKRGKTNEPAFIEETYRFIAELKGITVEHLSKQIEKNFESFLKI